MKTGNNAFSLDTNIIIDLFKGRISIADNIDRARLVYLPIPTLAELYVGAEISKHKEHNLQQIEALLQTVTVLHTSIQTATIYGQIKVHLRRNGTPIPENDIWIAALSKEHNVTLVTMDKHFRHIPELNITKW